VTLSALYIYMRLVTWTRFHYGNWRRRPPRLLTVLMSLGTPFREDVQMPRIAIAQSSDHAIEGLLG